MKCFIITMLLILTNTVSSKSIEEFNSGVIGSVNNIEMNQLAITEKKQDKSDTFESKMVKLVMSDTYMQYRSNKSVNSFLYDEKFEKKPFAQSFASSNYQGVIEMSDNPNEMSNSKETFTFTPYKYYIDSTIIYWEIYNPSGKKYNNKSGKIDINKFYKENLINNSTEKCPWCVAVVGLGIAGCITTVAMCNSRCDNCIYGAKVCESSCFTNSCTVTCNAAPVNSIGGAMYNAWDSFLDWTLLSPNGEEFIDTDPN